MITRIAIALDDLFGFIMVLLLGVFLCTHASAADTTYPTRDAAATAALAFVYNLLPAYESGGVILQMRDGSFTVGSPRTDFAGDHVVIDEDPQSYTDGTIVATYHVHPCLPTTHFVEKFSPSDLRLARIARHAAYMGDICTGAVHVWEPGVDGYDAPNERTGSVQLSSGRIVGHFAVTGTPSEHVERTAAQSWDQENLKANDKGCPTAIFIAPGGSLVQCP